MTKNKNKNKKNNGINWNRLSDTTKNKSLISLYKTEYEDSVIHKKRTIAYTFRKLQTQTSYYIDNERVECKSEKELMKIIKKKKG